MPNPINISIPLLTVVPGLNTVGPTPLLSGYTLAVLSIDRTTGASSWNSSPATTSMVLTIQLSLDNGATFNTLSTATLIGGTYIDDETGLTETVSSIEVPLTHSDLSTRQVKALYDLIGSSVSFSGSLTVT